MPWKKHGARHDPCGVGEFPEKQGLETHLQPADHELVADLTAKGKQDLLDALLGTVPKGLTVSVVMQSPTAHREAETAKAHRG